MIPTVIIHAESMITLWLFIALVYAAGFISGILVKLNYRNIKHKE